MAFHLVGVDLGGTKIATALTDTQGEILRYETVATDPARGPGAIVEQMVASIRRVTALVRPESVLGVGVACAGLIENATGRVIFSPNLHWEDLALGTMLREALRPWEVFVANDVSMAALGEHAHGASRGHDHVVTVFVGTGIGAGLIANGELYVGASGFAGEVGQMTLQWNAAADAGSWEALGSGSAMQQRAREALAAGQSSLLSEVVGGPGAIAVEDIASAAQRGDALSIAIVDQTVAVMGAGVANLIAIFNPQMVVLGGGVVRGVPHLVERVREAAFRRLMPGLCGRCTIVQAQFGREAAVLGATVFVKHAGRLGGSTSPEPNSPGT